MTVHKALPTKHTLPIRKRNGKWQLDLRRLGSAFYPEGNRSGLVTFGTKAQAEGAAFAAWSDYQASLHQQFDFSAVHRTSAIQAFNELEGYPPSAIVEAVKLYKEHFGPEAGKRTVSELLTEFMASHTGAGNAAVTLYNYNQALKRFAQTFGQRQVHTIRTAELETWMNQLGFKDINRKNYRRYLVIFFKFAIDRGYARSNPARAIPKVKVIRRQPGILKAAEVGALLAAAQKHDHGIMVPYFAIACLAGLRPQEIRRLKWDAIDMSSREIFVSHDVSKTNEDRAVPMPDNLLAWLQLTPPSARRGVIYWNRPAFDAVRETAGVLKKWKQCKDIARHSCASHLYRLRMDANYTTAAMGHGLNVFMRYYKQMVSEAEAKAYFDIRPPDTAKRSQSV